MDFKIGGKKQPVSEGLNNFCHVVASFCYRDCFHLQEEQDYVVYENHMSSSYEVGVGPRGSITRDSHYEWVCIKSISLICFWDPEVSWHVKELLLSPDRLLFQCRYSGIAVEALVMEVNGVPPPMPVAALGPLRVELKLGNGQCHSKGCFEGE